MAGLVKPPSLANNQSYLAPYHQLSPQTKARMAEARATKAAELEALAQKYQLEDAATNVFSAPGRMLGAISGMKGVEAQDRSSPLLKQAQALRNWKPDPNTLYNDSGVPHLIDPNAPLFTPGLVKPK